MLKKLNLLGYIFFLLIFLSGCMSQENTMINNTSNIANGSTFYQYKNNIYHSSPTGIFRFNANMNKTEKILDGSFGTLLIEDDWIYTRGTVAGEGGIFRIDLKGEEIEKLVDLQGTYINKNENMLYFLHDGINGLNLETKEITKLSEVQGRYLYYLNNALYFINEEENSRLYRLDLSNQNTAVLSEDSITAMVIEDEHIYYVTEGKVKTLKTDGREITLLFEDNKSIIQALSVNNGRLYLSANDYNEGGWGLFLVDGENEKVLLDSGSVQNINIIGEQLFYLKQGEYYRMNLDGSNRQVLK